MRRRDLLVGGAALAVAVLAGAMARLFARREAPTAPGPPAQDFAFAPSSAALLLAVADVVVPRYGEHPAASEIDFISRLERWVHSSPTRVRLYRRGWSGFQREVRARTAAAGDRPDAAALAALLERWHREYRQGSSDPPARFFEQLRRDSLRAYYASPAGWASVGYSGPVVRDPSLEVPGP